MMTAAAGRLGIIKNSGLLFAPVPPSIIGWLAGFIARRVAAVDTFCSYNDFR